MKSLHALKKIIKKTPPLGVHALQAVADMKYNIAASALKELSITPNDLRHAIQLEPKKLSPLHNRGESQQKDKGWNR